ncbi:hypothetical protein GKC32_01315 [Lactobacillus curvatus]|nr:hypothetical protein [Latilactobacillus curvatus]
MAVGGFTINVGVQVEIDNFFEEVPMNTWQDRISEAFRIRKELNEKYIYSDHKLFEYEKDYFRKYSGNPMDTYKGLTNGN